MSNISSLYKETGWQSLEIHRHILTLKMLYKIINNESANYLKDILLPKLSEVPYSLQRLCQDIDTRPSVSDFIFPRNGPISLKDLN